MAHIKSRGHARGMPDAPPLSKATLASITPRSKARPTHQPVAERMVPWLSSRVGVRKVAALRKFGGTAQTERAVANGLAYLASRQRRHGGWGAMGELDVKYGEVAVGKSALVLLAFVLIQSSAVSATKVGALQAAE